jgi:ribosomal protein S27AE
MSKLYRVFNKIDTVEGFCEECGEQTILVAIVSEFYRCTNCGHDTKQHINGRIKMAKQKFTHFVPREKPRKRPGRHKKRLNKHEKRQQKG